MKKYSNWLQMEILIWMMLQIIETKRVAPGRGGGIMMA